MYKNNWILKVLKLFNSSRMLESYKKYNFLNKIFNNRVIFRKKVETNVNNHTSHHSPIVTKPLNTSKKKKSTPKVVKTNNTPIVSTDIYILYNISSMWEFYNGYLCFRYNPRIIWFQCPWCLMDTWLQKKWKDIWNLVRHIWNLCQRKHHPQFQQKCSVMILHWIGKLYFYF